MILARDQQEDLDTQKHTWEYAFAHDCGVLNLRAGFKHANATIETLNALKDLTATRTNFSVDAETLVQFAHLHALYHATKNTRALVDLLQAHNHSERILDYVITADRLTTALEIPALARRTHLLRTFTTALTQATTNNTVNVARMYAHSEIMCDFLELLDELRTDIAREVDVDFDPVLTKSFDSILYVLDHYSHEDVLKRRLAARLTERVNDVINFLHKKKKKVAAVYTVEDYIRVILGDGRANDKNIACIFCNQPAQYVSVKRPALLSIFKSVSAEFWWKKHRDKFGICNTCLYALTRFELSKLATTKRLPSLILSQEDFMTIRAENIKQQLRKWQQLTNKRVCKPDGVYLNLETWLESEHYSQYEDIDTRREAYLYTKELYEKTLEALKESNIEYDDYNVIAYLNADIDKIVDVLEDIDFTALHIESLKSTKGTNIVNMRGFRLDKDVGLPALLVLDILLKHRSAKETFLASKSCDEFLSHLTELKLKTEDVATLVANYTSIEEAFDALREVCI